jgi:hypothetical protein
MNHCSAAQALSHSRNKKPQKVHKCILETWSKNSEIGILEYCTHSTKEETKLFESFLILFLKTYDYNISNIRHGSLYYHWQNQQKLISINIGFLLAFKVYQNFINGVCTPIKITDVVYTPRKIKTKNKNLVKRQKI